MKARIPRRSDGGDQLNGFRFAINIWLLTEPIPALTDPLAGGKKQLDRGTWWCSNNLGYLYGSSFAKFRPRLQLS